jgi:hypothetical protein
LRLRHLLHAEKRCIVIVQRMVQRADGTGYRRVSEKQYQRLSAAGRVVFEGVDGDESTDTVTYWYLRIPR